ncbi:MAG: GNAT family N-acetyltransferase [Nannocystaceae bacterium]
MAMAVPLEIVTERLRMTRIGEQHLDDLVELDADPEVMRYISDGLPNSRQTYVDELLPRMAAYTDQPYGYLAAYERDQDQQQDQDRFVGWFHLRPSVADEQVLELGYRLRRDAWGRGLATEGGRALVRYAFETLDQAQVDACADPRNAASIRVLVKCGMRKVGSFVHPQVPIEVVRYLVERGPGT